VLCGETDSNFMADNPAGVQSKFKTVALSTPLFDTALNGFQNHTDAWIAVVSADLKTLKYWTYLGGDGRDRACFATQGSNQSIWVCGFTDSDGCPTGTGSEPFPVPQGGLCYGARGNRDVFVAQISGDLQFLNFSTVIGGDQEDSPRGSMVVKQAPLAVDTVFLSGRTQKSATTAGDFPLVNNPNPQLGNNGSFDAFVLTVRPQAPVLNLLWSTLIGGTGEDHAEAGIRLDATKTLLFIGGTTKSQSTGAAPFPVSTGAYQTSLSGTSDAFLARLDAGTGSLQACTYVGGAGSDSGGFNDCLELDAQGHPVLAGASMSVNGFVGSGAPSINRSHSEAPGSPLFNDAFVVVLDPGLGAGGLLFGSYFGGTQREEAAGLAVDSVGNIYLSGETRSPTGDFPVTITAFDPTYTTNTAQTSDGFLLKFYYRPSTGLITYSTYFGGDVEAGGVGGLTFDERGSRIRCLTNMPNQVGYVLMSCATTMTDMPSTAGVVFQTQQGGNRDGFAAIHITN